MIIYFDNLLCQVPKLLLMWITFEYFSFPATFFTEFFKFFSVVEEDAKYMAKRKMLGNIKFMGELGKMEIVHDTILHR